MSDQAILVAGITAVAAALGVLWLRADSAHQRCERDRSQLWRAVFDLSQGRRPTLPVSWEDTQPRSLSLHQPPQDPPP